MQGESIGTKSLEQLRRELRQIDAPVPPDMSLARFQILVLATVVIEQFAEVRHALEDKVTVAASDEIECRFLGKLRLQFTLEVGIDRTSGLIVS